VDKATCRGNGLGRGEYGGEGPDKRGRGSGGKETFIIQGMGMGKFKGWGEGNFGEELEV